MNISYFTSMDRKYYNHCGKAMLQSFSVHQPKHQMHLYNEGGFIPGIERITPMGWDLGIEYNRFIKRHRNKRVVTFAKKAFSVIHAMNNLNADRIVWLDADGVLTMHIHPQLIQLMCPEDTLSAHFKVRHVKNDKTYVSCETGFFILNKNHPGFNEFKETYTKIYVNDEAQNLRRFYDGEVYGETVQRLERRGAKMNDLNPGGHKTPISRSVLKPYFQHLKAGLKDKYDNDSLQERFLDNEV